MSVDVVLEAGKHKNSDDGVCLLELVSLLAGEPFTDHPGCVSPVLAGFGRSLNDELPDDKRQRLLPLAPRMIGTARDGMDEARGFLALDWLVRVYLPAWLRLTPDLVADADALAGFRPITDLGSAAEVGVLVRHAKKRADVARVAVGAAAGDAAWAAASAAASAAVGDAAGDAAWAAASAAASAAVGDAAWATASAAASAAARDVLAPTVDTLQDSAIDLLDRMIAPGVTA